MYKNEKDFIKHFQVNLLLKTVIHIIYSGYLYLSKINYKKSLTFVRKKSFSKTRKINIYISISLRKNLAPNGCQMCAKLNKKKRLTLGLSSVEQIKKAVRGCLGAFGSLRRLWDLYTGRGFVQVVAWPCAFLLVLLSINYYVYLLH